MPNIVKLSANFPVIPTLEPLSMHSWAAKKPGMGAAEKLRHLLDSGFQLKNATKNIQRGELWVYTRYIHLQFGYVRYIHLQVGQ